MLTIALDAICYDFRGIVVSDCSAAASEGIHMEAFHVYVKTVYPLLRVSTSSELLSDGCIPV